MSSDERNRAPVPTDSTAPADAGLTAAPADRADSSADADGGAPVGTDDRTEATADSAPTAAPASNAPTSPDADAGHARTTTETARPAEGTHGTTPVEGGMRVQLATDVVRDAHTGSVAVELVRDGEPGEGIAPHVLPAPARRRRAGRNMVTATAVGLGLAGLVIASLFLQKDVFVGVVVLAVVAGSWELTTALRRADLAAPLLPVALGVAAMQVAAYLSGAEALGVSLAIVVVVLAAWRLLGPSNGFGRDLTASIFIVVYLGLLAGFAILLVRPDDGPWRVVSFIVLVVCSDLGGFAVGVFFGRHPMSPTVSPKKSWEGFAGSVAACVVAGWAIVVLGFEGEWWQGVVLGLAAVCSATLGDLGESMIKRDLGVKDMSNLLPGHGGVMDRLDSLLVTAPVVWLLLTAFVPPVT